MTQGVLIFARNNSQIDYVKQAYFLATRINKYMSVPVSIATDCVDYLKDSFPEYSTVFDKVVEIPWIETKNLRKYYDGTLSGKQLQFKNDSRSQAFDLTPYEETLVLDSDFIVSNNVLSEAFNQSKDLLLYKTGYDLAHFRDCSEFEYISDAGVDFYWATAVFFRKTQENKIFFDLIKHIQENWMHYNSIFQINSGLFRNDFAFSIAIHIMNGYQQGDFAGNMPGKLFYTIDRDLLFEIQDDSFLVLVEKEKYLGEYTPIRFSGNNLHVMNKFSLNRIIEEQLNV